MPTPKKLYPNDCKKTIRNPNGTDSAEMNQNSHNGSLIYFDRLSFYVQMEKKQNPFSVIKLNTKHADVFTYQTINYVWITDPKNSHSRYSVE